MNEISKSRRATPRKHGFLEIRPTHCKQYWCKDDLFRSRRDDELVRDIVSHVVPADFLSLFAQAAQQNPTVLVLQVSQPQQNHVDMVSAVAQRLDHFEWRFNDLEHKVDGLAQSVWKQSECRHRFATLVMEWRKTRGHSAKIKDLVMNDAYQQIIGMGQPAIPLILEEFERQPGHWSWALTAITGEDPVPRSSRGRLKEMAAAWLQWGREKGYR